MNFDSAGIKSFIQDALDILLNIKDFNSYPLLGKTYTVILVLCVAALLPMPYEFYISLRMLVCIGLVIFLYTLHKSELDAMKELHYKYVLAALVVLYNPLFVVHLGSKLV